MSTDIEVLEPEASTLTGRQLGDRIIGRAHIIRYQWAQMAADLFEFQQAHGWTEYGYDDSGHGFDEWIDGELDIKRRAVYNRIAIHRELVELRQVPQSQLAELEISKVGVVLPAVRRGNITPDEALSDVKVLTRRDLETRYRSINGSSPGMPAAVSQVLDATSEPEPMVPVDIPDDVLQASVVVPVPAVNWLGVESAVMEARMVLGEPQRRPGNHSRVRAVLERLLGEIAAVHR